MIFDTTFLIDFLKNRKDATQKYLELKNRGEELVTTSISVFEMIQGISSFHSHEESEKTNDFLKSIPCLFFDFDAALIAGEITKELKERGQPIDVEDTMIAGIAKTRNQAILTRNTKHFERIPGIKTETY